MRRYRAQRPRVDVALAPIDVARLMGHRLVMDGREALDAARILGARALVPIHYALKPIPLLLQTLFTEEDLRRSARDVPDVEIACLRTGERWDHAALREGASVRHARAGAVR